MICRKTLADKKYIIHEKITGLLTNQASLFRERFVLSLGPCVSTVLVGYNPIKKDFLFGATHISFACGSYDNISAKEQIEKVIDGLSYHNYGYNIVCLVLYGGNLVDSIGEITIRIAAENIRITKEYLESLNIKVLNDRTGAQAALRVVIEDNFFHGHLHGVSLNERIKIDLSGIVG